MGWRPAAEAERVRLGILGGTFDPIHFGHLVAAEECRYLLQLDKVLVLPAGQPPHKVERRTAPAHHRLAMVELAVRSNPGLSVSRVEIDRGGPSYSVDTVAALREESGPAAEIYFIIGLDVVGELLTWHQPERLLDLCQLAAVSRPGYRLDIAPLLSRLPNARERIVRVPTPELDIASSDLRARVASGRPIKYQLPEAVEEYIIVNRLYLDEG